MWTVRRTSPCDQIKIKQSQIGITISDNSFRTLFQDGGWRGRRCLESHFHQNADRLLPKNRQLSVKNHKVSGNKIKTNEALISELNQQQFRHWIISLNYLRFVLSWFISVLHCYLNNFGYWEYASQPTHEPTPRTCAWVTVVIIM